MNTRIKPQPQPDKYAVVELANRIAASGNIALTFISRRKVSTGAVSNLYTIVHVRGDGALDDVTTLFARAIDYDTWGELVSVPAAPGVPEAMVAAFRKLSGLNVKVQVMS